MNTVEALLVAVLVTWFVCGVVEGITQVQIEEYVKVQRQKIKSNTYGFPKDTMQMISKRHREWRRHWKRQSHFMWKIARVYIIFMMYTPELKEILAQYEIKLVWITRIWGVVITLTLAIMFSFGVIAIVLSILRAKGNQWGVKVADKMEILLDENIHIMLILFVPVIGHVFYGVMISTNVLFNTEIPTLLARLFSALLMSMLMGLAMYQVGKNTYLSK